MAEKRYTFSLILIPHPAGKDKNDDLVVPRGVLDGETDMTENNDNRNRADDAKKTNKVQEKVDAAAKKGKGEPENSKKQQDGNKRPPAGQKK